MNLWKHIPGLEAYEVSNDGRIRRNGRELKTSLDVHGYIRVALARGISGSYRHAQVHRLMAESFFGDPNGLQVDHIDGDRKNNSIENLRYVTAKGNADNRQRLGRTRGAHKGENHHHACLTEQIVRMARSMRAQGMTYKKIASALKARVITVYDAINGKTWAHI